MVDGTRGPSVGKVLSQRQFTVSPDVLADYYEGLNLPTADDSPIPSTIASGPDNGYFDEIAYDNHFGHLWMRQQWELFAPMQAGQTYKVNGNIVDIYQKRDRSVVQYQVEFTDSSGRLAVRTQHHQSFLPDHDQRGEVEFRKPSSKPGARKFVVPDGDPVGELEKTISLEMCGVYFHGDSNYHTNLNASKELGFQQVVVGGRMTTDYVSHLLESWWGETWWTNGQLDVKFTNPVFAGDAIWIKGVDTGPAPDDPFRREAFLWIEKPDKTIALIATAILHR